MDTQEIIGHARRLAAEAGEVRAEQHDKSTQVYVQAREFLRRYAGEDSAFHKEIVVMSRMYSDLAAKHVGSILTAFAAFAEAGLHAGVSPERRAQLDVVADYLEQAAILLQNHEVHPAAPVMLIGATLEEFLRTWLEDAKLPLADHARGLDAYSSALRSAQKITKQDAKDIASWAGLRNSAAHGQWAEVGDTVRAQLMLEGVNMFIRKYSEPAA